MGAVLVFLLAMSTRGALHAGRASDLATSARQAGLDPQECYRVRDLRFARDEIKIYFSEGYLILGKPVNGHRITAVFAAEGEGGDGEVLMIPPMARERKSLAAFTHSPALNEHIQNGAMIFTNDAATEMLSLIRSGGAKKSEEMGNLLAGQWNSVVASFVGSFEVRIVEDLLSPRRASAGFFFGAFSGRTLGNFDLIWDPRATQQISAGQVVFREDRRYFDTWTNFPARPWRVGERKPEFSVIRIDSINIRAAMEADLSIKAVTRLRVTPARDEATISLDLSQLMQITRAKVDGVPADAYAPESMRANLLRGSENRLVLIDAGHVFPAGRSAEIEIHHEGNVVREAGNKVYYVGSRGNWYPNRMLQFAHYDVTFRYPRHLDLVAAGDLISEAEEGEFKISRRKTEAPIRIFGFNLGDYERTKVTRNGLTVEVFANRKVEAALQPRPRQIEFPPAVTTPFPRRGGANRQPNETIVVTPPTPDPTARLNQLASDISEFFADLTQRFGPPPLKSLSVTPIPGRFGQGFPGMVYLSTLTYLDPVSRPLMRDSLNQVFFSDILHAHEVAHQWWGNGVTSADYQDDWLMESLANYSALWMLERKKGPKIVEQVLEDYKANLLRKLDDGRTVESAGPVTMGHRLHSSRYPTSWSIVTYEKGTWILHMLRRRLGDAAFRKFLAEIYQKNIYRQITTDQFRETAQRYLPAGSVDPRLETFFEQWVYGTGVPSLKLTTTVSGKAPRQVLRGTLTQSDVDDEFTTWVPVEIQVGRLKPVVKWIQTSPEPVTFEVPVSASPAKVSLNPGNATLAR